MRAWRGVQLYSDLVLFKAVDSNIWRKLKPRCVVRQPAQPKALVSTSHTFIYIKHRKNVKLKSSFSFFFQVLWKIPFAFISQEIINLIYPVPFKDRIQFKVFNVH